jgi:hypothetical protein
MIASRRLPPNHCHLTSVRLWGKSALDLYCKPPTYVKWYGPLRALHNCTAILLHENLIVRVSKGRLKMSCVYFAGSNRLFATGDEW